MHFALHAADSSGNELEQMAFFSEPLNFERLFLWNL
jgi:hypothetical protein